MSRDWTIGRTLFAAVVALIGLRCLAFSEFAFGLEPVRHGVLPAVPWAWLSGAVLVAGGLALLPRRSVRAGALLLAATFLLWEVALWVPLMMANLKNAADDALHTLGFAAAALALAAPAAGSSRLGLAARLAFGVALVGYGVMHFVFFQFTADFIPAWIPFHTFWAAFTGATQIAAGLALLSGILARLAMRLSALQYAGWALLLHLPRALEKPIGHAEWSNLLICTGLVAASLIAAGALSRKVPA
jgi:uncharacterized membrane protein YphA (DoxX/SURF4 family)